MSSKTRSKSGDFKPTPYWWEATPLHEATAEPLPGQADVAIVGAGYTGLVAALTLARAGRSVLVLDAQAPGEGASTRSGGVGGAGLQRSFGNLVGDVGLEAAKAIYDEAAAARAHLETLIAEEGIECGYTVAGLFSGAVRQRDYDSLGRATDLLNKHLDLGVEMVPRAEQHREVGTDAYFGGRLTPYVATVNPAIFHAGLLHRAMDAGVTVIGHTRVTGIIREGQGFTANTSRGSIRARDIVVATNGYTDAVDPWLRRRVIPLRSRMIVTEPLAPEVMDRLIPKRRVVGDTRRLHTYFRPSPDGTRILLGGRALTGEAAGDAAVVAADAERLRGELIAVFPELDGVRLTHSWSGRVAMTFDLLPHKGVHDGVHFAAGFCGSGVSWGPWLGRKIALRLLGEGEERSNFDLHPMESRPLYWGNPWFMPVVFAWRRFRDRVGF